MEKKSKGGKGVDDNPSLPEFKERRGGYTEPKPVTPAEAQWLGISKSPKNIQDKYKIERVYTKTEKGEKVTIFDISISSGTGSVKMESHVIPFVGNEYLYFSVEDDKKIPFIRDSKQKSNSQVVDRVATKKVTEEKKDTVVVPKNDQAEKNVEGKLDEKKLTAIDAVMRAGKLSYRDDTTSPAKDVFLGEKDVLVAGKEKGQRYILVIEVFDKYEKTGDGSIKPLTRTVRGWVNKNAINKEIEKQEKVGAAGASSAAPGPTSPESSETIFDREYALMISAYNTSKEMLYTAAGKDAETVVASYYTNWLKLKYMQTTKKIAPISFTKEDLEAVLNKVRATAPKAIVEEKEEEIVEKSEPKPIISPYVEPVKPEPKKEEPAAVLSSENKIEASKEKREEIIKKMYLKEKDEELIKNGYPLEDLIINKIVSLIDTIKANKEKENKDVIKWIAFIKTYNDFLIELGTEAKMVATVEKTKEINKKEEENMKKLLGYNVFNVSNAENGEIQFLAFPASERIYFKLRVGNEVWCAVKGQEIPLDISTQVKFAKNIDEKYKTEMYDPVKSNAELEKLIKTEPVIEKTVVDSSLDDMTFQNKVDYIGRQIWSEQIKVPLPEFEVIILESEEEKKQLTLIQSWDLEILIKEMEEMVANKTEEAVKIGIDLLQRDIQKLKDFREKREAIKTAYELKQVEMYPNVPENFLTMTLEEKKADIERRRREKIESLPSEVSYVASNINALKRDIQVGSNTSTKKTEEMSDPEKLEYLFTNSEEFIADAIKEGNYAEPKVKSLEKELEIVKEINVRYGAELTALENKELGEKTDPLTQKLNAIVRKRGISGMRFGYEYTDFISSGLEYPDLTKELQEEQEKVLSVIREEHQTELSRKIAENEKIQKNAKGKKVESVINEGGESFNGIEKTEDKHSIFNITKNNEVEIRDEQRAMASINNILPSLYNWDEYPDKNSKIVVVKKPRVVLNTKGEASVTEKGKIVFINKI